MSDSTPSGTQQVLILVRHGEAVSKLEDPSRPLTARGREETARIAARLASLDMPVRAICHSGKRRAEETATILAQALRLRPPIRHWQGLDPDDPVAPLVGRVEKAEGPLVVAGHLPQLGRLASALVCGHAEAGVASFATSTMAILVRDGDGWSLAALVPPVLA